MLVVRKRGTKTFMQAGGKIEAAETPYDALARELGGTGLSARSARAGRVQLFQPLRRVTRSGALG